MSDTERSLLDAVLENPDDDLPRLVYADFLEEHGDATRAEFIRTQIAMSLSTTDEKYDSDMFASATKFIAKLPALHFKSLIEIAIGKYTENYDVLVNHYDDTVIAADHSKRFSFHFRRGFPERIFGNYPWTAKYHHHFINLPFRRVEIQEGRLVVQFEWWKDDSGYWNTSYTPEYTLEPQIGDCEDRKQAFYTLFSSLNSVSLQAE